MKLNQARSLKNAALTLFAVAAITAHAESGSGTYTLPMDHPPVWDLSGTYSEDFQGLQLKYTLNMEPSGKFTGQGIAAVDGFLGYDVNLGVDVTFSGKVSSAGSVTRVSMNIKMKGSGTVQGTPVTFNANVNERLEINPAASSLRGTVSGNVNVTAPTMHKHASSAIPHTQVDTSLPAGMDGKYDLNLQLSNDGKKYSGLGAVVLSNGKKLPVTVSGTYTEKSDASKLKLKGQGAGAINMSLAATFDHTQMHLQSVTGKALGQKVSSQ